MKRPIKNLALSAAAAVILIGAVGSQLHAETVVAWGLDQSGSTAPPALVQSATSVAAGGYHSMALLPSGAVVCWGSNGFGQCNVPSDIGQIVQITAGRDHSAALTAAGGVVCWGSNGSGQCAVPSELRTVRFIAGGFASTLAIRADGTIACWGNITAPKGLPTAAVADAGGAHAVLLRSNGTVFCWGDDSFGQSTIPVALPMCSAVSAGLHHSVALTTGGEVVCWGRSDLGQCAVPTDLPLARDVTAGSFFTTALLVDGTVRGWGHNSAGQPGPPTPITDVMRVDCGEHHAIALRSETPLAGAVEWRKDEGGNGHWYSTLRDARGFNAATASSRASAIGAHLFTGCGSEFDFAVQSTRALDVEGWIEWGSHRIGPWIGLRLVAGDWGWPDETNCLFDRWDTADGQPNNGLGEDAVVLYATSPQPVALCHDIEGSRISRSAIVEWSADCNGDGIVDFGQCRAGELADGNANNIPDCCELGIPCVASSDPVQWPVADGGNGHWYQARLLDQPVSWTDASNAAELAGGHLATITSLSESHRVFEVSAVVSGAWACDSDCWGPWLGGFQDLSSVDYSEPNGGWRWVTDEPWGFTAWGTWLPNNALGNQHYLHLYGDPYVVSPPAPGPTWDDAPLVSREIRSFVIEWDLDCNGDGIVDFGQIRAGELADANGNNIPDACECPADLNGDGFVGAADLPQLLNSWGMTGASSADLDGDGFVGPSDLTALLAAWGSCGR